MTAQPLSDTQREAAAEIGGLVNRIFELAPAAGLHVGIKIKPARAAILKAQPGGE